MSAIPEDFISKTTQLSEDVTKPFAGSKKIYITGSRPDIRVPMREVTTTPTHTDAGEEANLPITVYDTSGPYTDPEVSIDLLKGLPDVRVAWIEERADTEQLDGPTSEFGVERQNDPELAKLRFEHIRNPRKAKKAMINQAMSRKCITPAKALLLRKWSLLRFVKTTV